MLNVPFGAEALDMVAQFLSDDEGLEILKYLESLLD
jgi:hypothetical protein